MKSTPPNEPVTPPARFDADAPTAVPTLDIAEAPNLPAVSGVDVNEPPHPATEVGRDLAICEFEVYTTQLGDFQPPNPNPNPWELDHRF
jgi:hypothetical protein